MDETTKSVEQQYSEMLMYIESFREAAEDIGNLQKKCHKQQQQNENASAQLNKIISTESSRFEKLLENANSTAIKLESLIGDDSIAALLQKVVDEDVNLRKENAELKKNVQQLSSQIATFEKDVQNVKISISQSAPATAKWKKIEYNDIDTIENLYEKYGNDDEWFIVEKVDDDSVIIPSEWENGICFVVTKIESKYGLAHGIDFLNGKSDGKNIYKSNNPSYRIYSGEYVSNICDYMNANIQKNPPVRIVE